MISQIRPADFSNWVAEQTSAPVVLDVREPWELETASIKSTPSFKLVAIPMGEIAKRINELPSSTPIACLCHHGRRSQQVANYLVEHGLSQVVNIAGGIDAWSKEVDASIATY